MMTEEAIQLLKETKKKKVVNSFMGYEQNCASKAFDEGFKYGRTFINEKENENKKEIPYYDKFLKPEDKIPDEKKSLIFVTNKGYFIGIYLNGEWLPTTGEPCNTSDILFWMYMPKIKNFD